jgi:hypothetical protein
VHGVEWLDRFDGKLRIVGDFRIDGDLWLDSDHRLNGNYREQRVGREQQPQLDHHRRSRLLRRLNGKQRLQR